MEDWRHQNYLKYIQEIKNPLEKEFYEKLYLSMDEFQTAIKERMELINSLLDECKDLSEKYGIPFDFSSIDYSIISRYYPKSTSHFLWDSKSSDKLEVALIGLFGENFMSEYGDGYPSRTGWQPSQIGC